MTDWTRLLSAKRLGRPGSVDDHEPGRAPFEIDLDRIAFSESWRALQGKTQVHGMLGAPRVRDRLTHSMEVSRVARTLGVRAGARMAGEARARQLGTPPQPADLGHLCVAAAAAHDFGTPPFAHVGEQAISSFFAQHEVGQRLRRRVSAPMAAELVAFEGNAQGFRDLARLQGWRRRGGLNLTCATLAAHAKYPYRADAPADARLKAGKYGHLAQDHELFAEVARATGLVEHAPGVWGRHPAAHLVEAADDICYLVVDLEDAGRLGVLPHDEVEELMVSVIGDPGGDFTDLSRPADRLACLRSKAISQLVEGAIDAFMRDLDQILAGTHAGDLIANGPHAAAAGQIARVSKARIYRCDARLAQDARAHAALTAILADAGETLLRQQRSPRTGARQAAFWSQTIPEIDELPPRDLEGRVRRLLDWLAARTDAEALTAASDLPARRPARRAA